MKIACDSLIRHENKEYTFKQLVDVYLKQLDSKKSNHKTYRRIVRKVERKFRRQCQAVNSPAISTANIEKSDEESSENEVEKSKMHQIWLEREALAQIEFRARKQRESRISEHVTQSNPPPNQLEDRALSNPELDLDQLMLMREPCRYFIRTGVCRNGNMCNRSHLLDYSQTSREPMTTLIFPSMYRYMLQGYEVLKRNTETDEILEYDENDIRENFKVFYDEILSEFRKHGRVVQLLVCSNYQTHLRGNVYVQYDNEESTKNAFKELNNWEFHGKRAFCFFTHVKNWRLAVCGDFLRNKCKNGLKCNFMHVFQNPYNHFPICSYNPSVVIIQKESSSQNRSGRVETNEKKHERRDMPKLRSDEPPKTRRELSTERESSRYREKRMKYKH